MTAPAEPRPSGSGPLAAGRPVRRRLSVPFRNILGAFPLRKNGRLTLAPSLTAGAQGFVGTPSASPSVSARKQASFRAERAFNSVTSPPSRVTASRSWIVLTLCSC